jgi:hypothetical protein
MSEENRQQQNLEDNLPMVSYIMLHRIYDVLTLIAKNTSKDDGDEVSKLIAYHDQGYLLGPVPSFTSEKDETNG